MIYIKKFQIIAKSSVKYREQIVLSNLLKGFKLFKMADSIYINEFINKMKVNSSFLELDEWHKKNYIDYLS